MPKQELVVVFIGSFVAILLGLKYVTTPTFELEVIGHVPIINWTPDKEFAWELVQMHHPIILRNTSAIKWRCIGRWTSEYISRHIRALVNVRNGTDRVFVAAGIKSGQLPSSFIPRRDNFQTQNVTMDDFIANINATGRYFYYSGPLSHWSDIASDTDPRDFMVLDRELSFSNVWFGHAHVIANTHYDRSENFFVQIHGRKRWLLFDPTQWESMYLYPSIHPHYHQSQVVDFETPNLKLFPRFGAAKALEAILEPGDLLYNPPYWFHRVEALDVAASLSTVSPSREELLWNELIALPLPFDPQSGWSLQQRALAAIALIKSLIVAVDSEAEARREPLLEGVLRVGRYFDRDMLIGGFIRRALLENRYRQVQWAAVETSPMYNELTTGQCYRVMRDNDPYELEKQLQPFVQRAAGIINEMPNGVRQINLANYIEELARWAVGVENVYVFLMSCFS